MLLLVLPIIFGVLLVKMVEFVSKEVLMVSLKKFRRFTSVECIAKKKEPTFMELNRLMNVSRNKEN